MAPPRAGFVPEEEAKPRCCTARIILQQRRIPRLSRADPPKAMPVLHSLAPQQHCTACLDLCGSRYSKKERSFQHLQVRPADCIVESS